MPWERRHDPGRRGWARQDGALPPGPAQRASRASSWPPSATPRATCSVCWSKYTGLATYGDYEAMLAEADLDAVLIATPSKLHAAMVQSALERDLHVFCEKPLTLDPDDAGRLAELAARARSRHPGRLPQPLRRGLRRGQGAARRRRDRRGHPRLRRGLRPGGAEAEGQDLAQPARPRAAAASTTTPPT